jgi:hypothetical protein
MALTGTANNSDHTVQWMALWEMLQHWQYVPGSSNWNEMRFRILLGIQGTLVDAANNQFLLELVVDADAVRIMTRNVSELDGGF